MGLGDLKMNIPPTIQHRFDHNTVLHLDIPSSIGEKVKRKKIGKGVLFIKGHFNLFP